MNNSNFQSSRSSKFSLSSRRPRYHLLRSSSTSVIMRHIYAIDIPTINSSPLFISTMSPHHLFIDVHRSSFRPQGGGGGMSHWGLYIIRVNHFLKSTLNEDEATVPTALWTLHRACAAGYCSQISYPFRGSSADLSGGSVNLIPFFHIFLFSIPLTRYARYLPGGEIDTLFTCFYWRGWCTGPNETCAPPPPPGHSALSSPRSFSSHRGVFFPGGGGGVLA